MSKFDKQFDKSRRRAPDVAASRKNSSGGTLLGIFIGLVIGVLIAFGVVWYLNKAPLPFQNKYEGAPKAEKPAAAGGAAGEAQTSAPLPGKPGEKPGGRFEFYGILEGKQPGAAASGPAAPGQPAPSQAAPSQPGPAQPTMVEAKPAPNEVFFLQVGAFQKAADADNLKAKLALSGLEAGVQEISIPDKGTMYRVRVGPFRDPDEMNRARALLSQNGVQGAVIKQRE